jgi:predicted RNase H-like nuclease (RuvC/YqgF family)
LADALDRVLGLDMQAGRPVPSSPAVESRLNELTAEIESLKRQIEILNRQFIPLRQTIIELRRALQPLVDQVSPKPGPPDE